MPAFSNSPWSNGGADYFNRVPRTMPVENSELDCNEVEESQAEINQRVYNQLISDNNFSKVLKFNGFDVVVSKGNSSAKISIFYHDQRAWEMISNDLPIPHSWRDDEWHTWFDNQVFNLVNS